jgi:carboxypeptidase C (cathepsin A)
MSIALTALRRLGWAAIFVAITLSGSARAQDATPSPQPSSAAPAAQKAGPGQGGGGRRSTEAPATPAVAEQHKLPPDSTTKQTVDLPGRSLSFTATAGSVRLFDDKGEPQADIAYTSYQLDGADRATRPVTFLFNGGPGAASAYL